jgi:ubiquinone/menaquinone biosynthesis C-methylase UbiE
MMKMGRLEKLFVNSPSHSRQVSQHAERLLHMVDFKAGQKYLDVGCGNGAAAIHLARKYGLNVTGIDVDPAQIRLANAHSQKVNKARFLTTDGTRLPFEDGQFEIVFTNKVTHHIPNWREALAEMIRVVKPGGFFIYSDLVLPLPLAKVGEAVAGNLIGFPTKREIETTLKARNFAIIHHASQPFHFESIFQNVGQMAVGKSDE